MSSPSLACAWTICCCAFPHKNSESSQRIVLESAQKYSAVAHAILQAVQSAREGLTAIAFSVKSILSSPSGSGSSGSSVGGTAVNTIPRSSRLPLATPSRALFVQRGKLVDFGRISCEKDRCGAARSSWRAQSRHEVRAGIIAKSWLEATDSISFAQFHPLLFAVSSCSPSRCNRLRGASVEKNAEQRKCNRNLCLRNTIFYCDK